MNLLDLLTLLKKHLGLMLALPLVAALATAVYAYEFLPDTYSASTSMYVKVKGDAADTSSALYSDLSASQQVTNDVAQLITSNTVAGQTAAQLGLDDLSAYELSVTNQTTSRVITLTVTGTDAQGVADVANNVTANVTELAQSIMDIKSVNTIETAVKPDEPSGPNRKLYVAVGFLAGALVAGAIVVVRSKLNTKVCGQDELEELLGIPVLGRIPQIRGGA